MRVIAGAARGIRLTAPSGMKTRPTADRVREALFSILQSRFGVEGAAILDLCAGTGALGIEALSRGAASCCFVEKDRNVVKCIRQNLVATRFEESSSLLEMDVSAALSFLGRRGYRYDLIFFDPPYASPFYEVVAETVVSQSLLAIDGVFVAESASRNPLPDVLGGLVKIDRRVYGDTAIELFVMGE